MTGPDLTPADGRWLPLRFRDLDAFGHVYHAEYLTLLDEARTRWFGDTLRVDHPGSYVVGRVEIDYVSSLSQSDRGVRVDFGVAAVGTTSLTLTETMRATDERVVARVRSVVVLRDPVSGTSRPLSAAERRSAEEHLR